MSYKDLPGFQVVNFKSERDGVFQDLLHSLPFISGVAEDNSTFIFKIVHNVNTRIYLSAIEESRKPRSNEILRLIFSLSTGQYALASEVQSSTGVGSIVIDFNKAELLRLQRRDSFRIVIPPSISLEFYLNSKISRENALKVADVSLGGASLRMTSEQLKTYWIGSSIKGSLVLAGREPIELQGIIRHHFPKEAGQTHRAGVQFTPVSNEQQRELLSLSLQLHREINKKD